MHIHMDLLIFIFPRLILMLFWILLKVCCLSCIHRAIQLTPASVYLLLELRRRKSRILYLLPHQSKYWDDLCLLFILNQQNTMTRSQLSKYCVDQGHWLIVQYRCNIIAYIHHQPKKIRRVHTFTNPTYTDVHKENFFEFIRQYSIHIHAIECISK